MDGYPAAGDLRDMVASHTLFRREFSLAAGLVAAVADADEGRVRLACDHLDTILTLLTLHHRSIESCQWQDADPDPGGRVVRLVDGEHTAFHRLVGRARTLTATWRAGAGVAAAAPLAAVLRELTALISDQMARREEAVLWPRAAAVPAGAISAGAGAVAAEASEYRAAGGYRAAAPDIRYRGAVR
jgi:hypothetical protein